MQNLTAICLIFFYKALSCGQLYMASNTLQPSLLALSKV